MEDMISTACGSSRLYVNEPNILNESLNDSLNEGSREFDDLIKDCNEEPHKGCIKYSMLSFLLKLYKIKCLYGISGKAMNMIRELLKEVFEQIRIPNSFYEVKKTINKLDLNCTKNLIEGM